MPKAIKVGQYFTSVLMKRFLFAIVLLIGAHPFAIAIPFQKPCEEDSLINETIKPIAVDQQNPISWKITKDEEADGTIIYNLIVSNHTNKDLYVTGKVKVQSTKEIVRFAKTIKAGHKMCVHSEVNEKFAVLQVDYQESMW